MIRVLYDGWPLVYQPNSPEALHLMALLEQRHPELHASVALPADPPDWLPAGAVAYVAAIQDTPRSRLIWEQISLPRLADELHADLLHLTSPHPPLFGKSRSVVSPAEFPTGERRTGFVAHLREAVSSGGMANLRGLLWPEDLSVPLLPNLSTQIYSLPAEPCSDDADEVSRSRLEAENLVLPETYILVHSPHTLLSLRRLLDAWSWAAGSIGEYYPLLLLGLDSRGRERLSRLLADYALGQSVQTLPRLHPGAIPALVQGSSAVFHPAPLPPWGSIARLALFYGKPLVASESPLADALAGQAAYLAPETNPRALGAGLITVIVEVDVAQTLSQAGRERATSWGSSMFGEKLFATYAAVLALT